jgi:hypothetical protein
LAELIVSQGDEKILESHRREIVVVFCDLRGYTAFGHSCQTANHVDDRFTSARQEAPLLLSSFDEPAVDRGKEIVSFGDFASVSPQASEVAGNTQIERARLPRIRYASIVTMPSEASSAMRAAS